ncbi:unnamed protein product, partial [Laminaria digitata]
GHTALTRACALGRLETAEILLDRGADINRLPRKRLPTTPQHHNNSRRQQQSPLASSSSTLALPTSREGVAAALKGGVGGGRQPPPLVAAAAAGHAAMVRLLLERGADPGIRDEDGNTAADLAKRGAFVDVLGELARKKAGFLGVAVEARGMANPPVPCGWGCGKLVATGEAKIKHEEECPHREVDCVYSCGEYRLQQRQLERHLAETCRLRPVVCSSRCGMSVTAEDYDNHQAAVCPMRPVVC